MDFGLAPMAAISAISYLIGLIVRATPYNNNKYIPIACGLSGGVLGYLSLFLHVEGMLAKDPITAIAVGVVSGLAATGLDQAIKQLRKGAM